jgi:hypothetical protein
MKLKVLPMDDDDYIQIAKEVTEELEELWRENNWKGRPPLVTVGVVELIAKRLCPTEEDK